MDDQSMAILEVRDLKTWFETSAGKARAVDGVSFDLERGKTLGIVGESGCGKTVLATSIMRLFRRPGVSHPAGVITFQGMDLLTLSPAEMQSIRGRHIAMIFQEPMAALNPVWTIKDQIAEPVIRHLKANKSSAYKRALELLEQLGVPAPDRVMNTWPHTLSGGMRQRVAIAMALACKPDILIADEPTTALDVTVQAQILRLIKDMQKQLGMAMILITHDLGVVNEIADDVMVMYSGRVIESGPAGDVLFTPKHPYTEKLLAAVPKINGAKDGLLAIEGQVRPATAFVEGCRFAERCPHAQGRCQSEIPPALYVAANQKVACFIYDTTSPLNVAETAQASTSFHKEPAATLSEAIVELENLKTWFPVQSGLFRSVTGHVKAVDDISLSIQQGKTLALVGESGCGKSTLGHTILRLVESTSGRAILTTAQEKFDILAADKGELKQFRKIAQIIFQDPFASLNPRFSVREIINEGLAIHESALSADQRDQKIGDILEEVGLPRDTRFRYPHEFSGGQRQRIAIARALVLKPKILILDEATSALDVSIQAQVLNLLMDLQRKYNMTYVFITHNLGVVRYIADNVAVMYLGKIVEYGATEQILSSPRHPYTQKLVASVPAIKPGATLPEPLHGDVPSPINPPRGCSFHPRCPLKSQKDQRGEDTTSCTAQSPDLTSSPNKTLARCHFQ
jgi:peptide/nickel transport system ATP-binding protein